MGARDMELLDVFPEVQGCYLLSPSGVLGRFDALRNFVPDVALSAALAPAIAAARDHAASGASFGPALLGIVHTDHGEHPWRSATLTLDPAVVRRLYPMAGVREGRLTNFQRRNRHKSFFRGLELLLDFGDPSRPGRPPYVPALVYRGRTLADYGVESVLPEAAARPALELINLAADPAGGAGWEQALMEMNGRMRRSVIRSDVRLHPNLVLMESRRNVAPAAEPAPADPYGDRAGKLPVAPERPRGAALAMRSYDAIFAEYCAPETRALLGRWMPASGETEVTAGRGLEWFDRFAATAAEVLEEIAAVSPRFSAPAGKMLLDRGTEDRWNLYLLSGTLELVAGDGQIRLVEAGSPSARRPVAFLKPRLFQVAARTAVEFLWLYEPLVDEMLRRRAALAVSA